MVRGDGERVARRTTAGDPFLTGQIPLLLREQGRASGTWWLRNVAPRQ
ncbi:hypothetical protein [Haloechinothrix alba]|nr:hypothetical protein [Haloechinothrix alba]